MGDLTATIPHINAILGEVRLYLFLYGIIFFTNLHTDLIVYNFKLFIFTKKSCQAKQMLVQIKHLPY